MSGGMATSPSIADGLKPRRRGDAWHLKRVVNQWCPLCRTRGHRVEDCPRHLVATKRPSGNEPSSRSNRPPHRTPPRVHFGTGEHCDSRCAQPRTANFRHPEQVIPHG